ncbi:hypothetical protein [Fusibacillus kribbianus]|uniref:Uncharacterized protein n=1 Tax=Fusibacillus kribbianus TaxID=3044208 RepID=A0AAP4BEJ1_9FIRM|nr:hypothetical protein [Ruminococcus sp. YH-rum2234]MDI9243199.1 hypothetical protein [Ruminococcus sp. YH-rum2234]
MGLLTVVLLLIIAVPAYAVAGTDQIAVNAYEGEENAEFNEDSSYSVSQFCYGERSVGSFSIVGSKATNREIYGYAVYYASDGITLQYDYDGSYRTDVKENWNIVSSDEKSVNGISVSKKIGNGVLIVQKSYDRIKWENAIEPVCNFFTNKKIDRTNLCSVSEEDLRAGVYYRVYVAYEMGRKTGRDAGSLWPPRFPSDIYEYRYCLETYQFYACYGGNPIEFRDLTTGNAVTSGATVESGFVIDTKGSTFTVTLTKNGVTSDVTNLMTVKNAGTYTITAVDTIGKKYTTTIKVANGISGVTISPEVYENKKNDGYTEDNRISGALSFGANSHTVLTVAQNSTNSITQSTHKGIPAYGITGSEVSLYLKLQNSDVMTQNGWEIIDDTWGKKTSQMICGVVTGQVDSGALIIQTSTDGVTWENVDLGKYSTGIYTTDYEANYGHRGDVLIYTPDGKAILNGVYVKVIYAYEAKQVGSKTDLRFLEEYEFYLCSDELGAVAFHNLSVGDQMSEIAEEYDDVTADIYQHSETMQTDAYTVSGFSIDTSLNPTVTYSVKKDGTTIAIPSNHQFTETGKYEVTLTSAANSKKTVTIYVDRMTTEDALRYYFGEAFITGKRIYSDGEYAVFEGGLTSYHIAEVDQYHLPLSGQIKNMTTGEVSIINATRSSKTGYFSVPGEYVVTLTTNADFNTSDASGDCKTFTFHFEIIAEGTAPGPVVNQRSLVEYAKTAVTDSYPVYYSLTYPSASTGYITLAFSSREEALAYAYDYEKGMVEQQKDGSYRYIGSFIVSQKEKYDSAWDLTDAVNFFAEQAIQVGYFDLSNEFTTLSLSDSVIESTPNLRTLELARSVTIFAPNQKTELTNVDALPIIAQKPYSFLTAGSSGHVSNGTYDFKFVQDKYKCDSNSVVIFDCNGKEYKINYNQGVGAQLAQQNCPSGVVTIRETTIYGDVAEYQAVFIAEGENTSSLTLTYHSKDGEKNKTYTQSDDGVSIETEAFSVKSLVDELDPYGLVIISDGRNEFFYAADQESKGIWSDPGEYQVKVVNRLGYYYVINVTVVESDYTTIRFNGNGTESPQDILTTYGAQNVKLPVLTRYGFNLIGFEDESGTLYSNEISTISFKGSVVLDAVWQAKQFTVTLQNPQGDEISTLVMDFGKEYELPVIDVESGLTFKGWSLNGTILESNLITIESEGDITLTAVVSGSADIVDNVGSSTDSSVEKNSSFVLVIVGIAVIFLVILYGMLVRKKHAQRKNSMMNDYTGEGDDNDEK